MQDIQKITFNEFQKILLEKYTLINNFFKENNIQWFAHSGTLLGAIRHEGLIPWDDDIDMGMHYSVYAANKEKIKEFCSKHNLMLLDMFDKRSYSLDVCKIVYRKKYMVEYEGKHYLYNPSIDLMLGSNTNHNTKSTKYLSTILSNYGNFYLRSKNKIWNVNMKKLMSDKLYYLAKPAYYFFGLLPIRTSQKMFKKSLMKNDSNFLMLKYSWSWRNDKFDLSELKEVKFANTTIMIPKNYIEILESSYKNWKEMPSKDKQKPHIFQYEIKEGK